MATPLPDKTPGFTFRKSLRFKFIMILFAISAASVAIGGVFNHGVKTIIWMIIVNFSLATIGSLLILKLLKPLEEIYKGSLVIAKGELKHRFNIHTGDEIQSIADAFNDISHNLDKTFQDITQKKDDAYSEKNKLNAIISSIADGVIVLDLHRSIVLANKAAENITGYSADEMANKQIDELFIIKNKEGGVISAKEDLAIHLLNKNNAPKNQNIVKLTRKDGYEIEVEMTLTPVNDSIQSDLGGILVLRDVTQKKVFEQMQIDFVSMASHEIRTPLTSVVNYLSVLKEEADKELTSEHKDFLARALISGQQLVSLVGNLLNVSKIERGSFAVSLQPVDWKKNINDVVENNSTSAMQKNIKLEAKLPSEPLPQVLVDPIRINEVLNNLISNALNYTKEGGTIEVSAKTKGEEVITSVSDTGVGIPPEAIPHLFSKFFRVSGSLEQGSKGTGLGLYISKSIIDMHHGKIWVESQVGKGTTFYFSLPIANPISATPTITQLLSK